MAVTVCLPVAMICLARYLPTLPPAYVVLVVGRVKEDWEAYANDGYSLDLVYEALGLVLGVLRHLESVYKKIVVVELLLL